MEGKESFLVLSRCILLFFILFIIQVNLQAGEDPDRERPGTYEEYQERTGGGENESPKVWVEKDEKGYEEDLHEEKNKGKLEEDLGYQKAPSDLQEEPSTKGPFEEERLPVNPKDDDDLARL